MKRLILCLTLLSLLTSLVGQANALDVAVLGGPGDPAWNDDVKAKLDSTGFFSTVDIINIASSTPTVAELATYDSVLVYSDSPGYANTVALGDNLADYVDAGGGVVIGVFANASIAFAGRFHTDNYWGIIPDTQAQGTVLTLGTVFDPGHPTMAGVSSFNGGSSSFHGTGPLHPNAIRIADWSNGRPLVVVRDDLAGKRVDLNFFAPSDAVRADFWDATTDGALLMGNALVYAGGIAPPAVSIDITVVPNPATYGAPLDILLDLDNPGDGFDAKFRLWFLNNGNVSTLVSLSPFVPAGVTLTDFPVFSTPSVSAGLPPVVGVLAAIFNAASGELLDWDFKSVGIGVAPSAADITALRRAATDFLNNGNVNAAPPRPELEFNLNGKAKNPFEQQVSVKGKLAVTWGGIKSQR